MTFKTLKDIEAFKGQHESKMLEFKQAIPSVDTIVKHIHGFLNGNEPVGYIIFGIAENEKGEADTESLFPIKFPILFNNGKQEISNFDGFKLQLSQSLRDSLPKYTEGMITIEYIEETLISITINHSTLRPLFNQKDEAFIRRDAATTKMSSHEIENAIIERQTRLSAGGQNEANTASNNIELSDYLKFICSDEVLTKLIPWGNIENAKDFKFTKSPYCFLYLSPLKQDNFSSNELKDIIQAGNLIPFGRCDSSWHERNKYGAITFNASMHDQGLTSNFSQLFSTGSIIGIESLARSARERDFDSLPTTYIEEMYTQAFKNYLNFAKSKLNITVPLKLVTGLIGVKGFCLALPPGYFEKFDGHIYDNEVITEVSIDSYECNIEEILKSFFEKIWKSAGLTRPNGIVIRS